MNRQIVSHPSSKFDQYIPISAMKILGNDKKSLMQVVKYDEYAAVRSTGQNIMLKMAKYRVNCCENPVQTRRFVARQLRKCSPQTTYTLPSYDKRMQLLDISGKLKPHIAASVKALQQNSNVTDLSLSLSLS